MRKRTAIQKLQEGVHIFMRIDSITGFHTQNVQDRHNKTYKNVIFMGAEVPKTLERFGTLWYKRLPVTFREFFDNLKDKSIYSPLQALAMAFAGLFFAKNIQDVKNSFPRECEEDGIFKDLKDYRNTDATNGLLSIYKENKELYKNGVLKNGEDLTVYLLKKLYLEGKTREQINNDLEKDLLEDIKDKFKQKFPNRRSEYIGTENFKKVFGIKRLDSACFSSFLQTQEEFNKRFKERCSLGQTSRWESQLSEQSGETGSTVKTVSSRRILTPEQRDAISKRNKERWDSLTPKQQRKIVESLNKGYREYWINLPKEEQERRINLLLAGWKGLTPAQRTASLNRIKCANERSRYAMYDAWNNSIDLILALSEFLKSKQGLRPSDLYTTIEFSEFQSAIMTEFWAKNKDMAEEFGIQISLSNEKIGNAIKNGEFEELKKQIENERDVRIQLVEKEKQTANDREIRNADVMEEINKTETIQPQKLDGYKKEFQNVYRRFINNDFALPFEYVDDMTDVIISGLPQEKVENMTKAIKDGSLKFEDIAKIFKDSDDTENYEKVIRYQRALEGTMEYMLCLRLFRGSDVFDMDFNNLKKTYTKGINELSITRDVHMQYSKAKYNDFKRNLSENELNNIVNQYFLYETSEDAKLIEDYIKSYGRSALLLFSEKSDFEDEVRMKFNYKFMRMMPDEVKDVCTPVLQSQADLIAEHVIQKIREKVIKRYDFMPKDFLNAYSEEVVNIIHIFSRIGDEQSKEMFSIKSFTENFSNTKHTNADGEEYHNYPYIAIPKKFVLKDNMIKILAAEQALADELFRVTGDEKIYELGLEELMNIFEIFTAKGVDGIIFDENGNERFEAKEKPKKYNLKGLYQEYVKELSINADNIFEGDSIKDTEELLYTLNPEVGKEHLDKYISNRIKAYYREKSDNV